LKIVEKHFQYSAGIYFTEILNYLEHFLAGIPSTLNKLSFLLHGATTKVFLKHFI